MATWVASFNRALKTGGEWVKPDMAWMRAWLLGPGSTDALKPPRYWNEA